MNIIQSFQGSNFVQFCISSMLYTYNETPEAILSVNFGLCWENLIKRCKMAEIIEEYVRLVLKTCERILGLKNFSRHELFLVISRCRKVLVMSTPKADNFMQLFWAFVGATLWPKCFLYVPGIKMNTLIS